MSDCKTCGAWLLSNMGNGNHCIQCYNAMWRDHRVTHTNAVRCPKCRAIEPVTNYGDDLEYDSEHEISCDSCGESYVIRARAEWTFMSPAMIGTCGDDEE